MREFDYDLDYQNLDLRAQPELYRVGRGEQGVLLVEPYKSEILPHWRFADPDIATESSDTIYQMFLDFWCHLEFQLAPFFRNKPFRKSLSQKEPLDWKPSCPVAPRDPASRAHFSNKKQ